MSLLNGFINLLSSISAGYALTEQDFENGRKIDLENEIPKGVKNPIDTVHSSMKGKGNYQGDLMLTPYQLQRIKGEGRALHPFVTYWPSNGTHVNIPYNISDPTFTSYERANIARAVEDYERNTCIR